MPPKTNIGLNSTKNQFDAIRLYKGPSLPTKLKNNPVLAAMLDSHARSPEIAKMYANAVIPKHVLIESMERSDIICRDVLHYKYVHQKLNQSDFIMIFGRFDTSRTSTPRCVRVYGYAVFDILLKDERPVIDLHVICAIHGVETSMLMDAMLTFARHLNSELMRLDAAWSALGWYFRYGFAPNNHYTGNPETVPMHKTLVAVPPNHTNFQRKASPQGSGTGSHASLLAYSNRWSNIYSAAKSFGPAAAAVPLVRISRKRKRNSNAIARGSIHQTTGSTANTANSVRNSRQGRRIPPRKRRRLI